jgi:hypothetical protein
MTGVVGFARSIPFYPTDFPFPRKPNIINQFRRNVGFVERNHLGAFE